MKTPELKDAISRVQECVVASLLPCILDRESKYFLYIYMIPFGLGLHSCVLSNKECKDASAVTDSRTCIFGSKVIRPRPNAGILQRRSGARKIASPISRSRNEQGAVYPSS
jgi:hypothetical protein